MVPLELDAAGILTTAITSLESVLSTVAPLAIGVGIAVFGLFFGWNIVRRFVS